MRGAVPRLRTHEARLQKSRLTLAGECPDGMVTKMQYSFAIFDDEGRESVVFTTAMKPDDLEDLSGYQVQP